MSRLALMKKISTIFQHAGEKSSPPTELDWIKVICVRISNFNTFSNTFTNEVQ